MATKYKHTTLLLDFPASPIIKMFFEYSQLKNLYRTGWLKSRVMEKDCETVADHTLGVALIAYTVVVEYRKDLDVDRVLRLAIFHELGEIYAGDITPHDGVTLQDKAAKEKDGVEKVLQHISNGKEIYKIWEEYENQSSPEAIFVKQIDRLEMMFQAYMYEKLSYNGVNEFFEYVKDKLHAPELKSVYDEIILNRNKS